MRPGGTLKRASKLLLERGPDLVAPPGSEVGLGALIGLAGLLVGLAMPTHVAIVKLIRLLFSDGAGAFVSALQAIPPPSVGLAIVAAALVITTVGLSGGWINAALAVARGEPVADDAWIGGVRRAGRIFGWNVVLIGWLGLLAMVGGQFGYLVIRSGLAASRGGDLLMPSLLGIGGLALWALTLGTAIYYLAISCLGAIVAVAEPRTPFWALFSRAPRLFWASAGWRGIGELAGLLATWWALKAVGNQLVVPLAPLNDGGQSIGYGVAGALFKAGLALGDGIVLLLVIVMGAIAYNEATSRQGAASAPEGGLRLGRLRPWPPLPGPRAGPRETP